MQLTSENVENLFVKCLFQDGETTPQAIKVSGVKLNVWFHPDRIEKHKEDIESLLRQCPRAFFANRGGGWSFLNLCQNENNEQWTGVHTICDQLVCLGMAIDKVMFLLPREMWIAFPGGMPYLQIKELEPVTA